MLKEKYTDNVSGADKNKIIQGNIKIPITLCQSQIFSLLALLMNLEGTTNDPFINPAIMIGKISLLSSIRFQLMLVTDQDHLINNPEMQAVILLLHEHRR